MNHGVGKNGGRVYSYLRFSDPKQATGSSVDRQLAYAQAWALQYDMELDVSLSLKDEGLSAYHQRHVKQGALGTFLQAVDEGRIPIGSVLVVEGLDRLSRAEPIQAQAQLAQIVNAGITVVTASDGREYNRASLKAEPMNLVYSLLVMIRAHEESDTKSKRVKAAIRRQCEGWIAGTYRGRVVNGKDPQWLEWDGNAWQFRPDRVEAVRFAIAAYRSGVGAARVNKQMHSAGLNLTDDGVSAQQIYRMIRLPALRGAKRISLDGEDYLLEGYYPRLLSDQEFADLEQVAGQRQRRHAKGEIVGVITGIGITQCGYCGTALVAQNMMNRAKADGRLEIGHRRLHCVSYSKNGGCKAGGSCSSVPVERALLSWCSDQINLQRLMEPTEDGQSFRQRVAEGHAAVQEIERQLAKITDALLADTDSAAPLVFVRKARDLEADLAKRQAAVQILEQELVARTRTQDPDAASKWAALAKQSDALDNDARTQVRQMVLDTFESLTIYMRGVVPDRRARFIDLLVKSRAGQTRWLRIDRRTGKWLEGGDWRGV